MGLNDLWRWKWAAYSPLTSVDIVGHEITHAVTQNTANLVL